MSFVFKCNLKQICTVARLYNILIRQSHYDTLNLNKNCTERQIKEAFLKLSKQYHPDINKDAKAQEKFVKILEAYNVLSKPNTRAEYDIINSASNYTYVQRTPYNFRNEYSYYYNEQKTEKEHTDGRDKSYYGVSGLQKMPNSAIIFMCFGFALFGLVLQMIVIRRNFISHRRQVDEKSRISAEHYATVRERALDNGNEMQARLLIEKIVTASNQSAATATLGQALASDKK